MEFIADMLHWNATLAAEALTLWKNLAARRSAVVSDSGVEKDLTERRIAAEWTALKLNLCGLNTENFVATHNRPESSEQLNIPKQKAAQ